MLMCLEQKTLGRLVDAATTETLAEKALQEVRTEIMPVLQQTMTGLVEKLYPKSLYVDYFNQVHNRILEQGAHAQIEKVDKEMTNEQRAKLRRFEELQATFDDDEMLKRIEVYDEHLRKMQDLTAQVAQVQQTLEVRDMEIQTLQGHKGKQSEEIEGLRGQLREALQVQDRSSELVVLEEKLAAVKSKLQQLTAVLT